MQNNKQAELIDVEVARKAVIAAWNAGCVAGRDTVAKNIPEAALVPLQLMESDAVVPILMPWLEQAHIEGGAEG